MSKFKKKVAVKQDIPTSSMPDVVFMLLFFFMVTTQLRETNINVKQVLPQATQLKKLARKSLVAYLYIGEPKKIEEWGKEPKIQANDVFIAPKDIIQWVNGEKSKLNEFERIFKGRAVKSICIKYLNQNRKEEDSSFIINFHFFPCRAALESEDEVLWFENV